jgi:hypothetical protein
VTVSDNKERSMKRVTKKLVTETLRQFNGWYFSHFFKEDSKIILSSWASGDHVTERLSAAGIEVVVYSPADRDRARTGYMQLRMKTE